MITTTYSPEAFAELQKQMAALQAAKAQAVADLDAEIEKVSKHLTDLRQQRNTLQPYPIDRPRTRTSSPGNQPNPNRDLVLAAVTDGCNTPKQIIERTGLDNSGVWYHLSCLITAGKIKKSCRGEYVLHTPDLTDDMA